MGGKGKEEGNDRIPLTEIESASETQSTKNKIPPAIATASAR